MLDEAGAVGEDVDVLEAGGEGEDRVAVEDVEAERILMLPPTYLTCLEVGQYADPAAVLDAARDRTVEMYTPRVEEDEDGGTLSVPERFEPLLASRA